MIGKIKRFFGNLLYGRIYGHCMVCGEWTELSVSSLPNVCSIECLGKYGEQFINRRMHT